MYSVLIVDDDKLARKGLIAITDWAKCGMQVVGDVANGKLAMDFLAEHQVEDPEGIKGFDRLGYHFEEALSTEKEYVFLK